MPKQHCAFLKASRLSGRRGGVSGYLHRRWASYGSTSDQQGNRAGLSMRIQMLSMVFRFAVRPATYRLSRVKLNSEMQMPQSAETRTSRARQPGRRRWQSLSSMLFKPSGSQICYSRTKLECWAHWPHFQPSSTVRPTSTTRIEVCGLSPV